VEAISEEEPPVHAVLYYRMDALLDRLLPEAFHSFLISHIQKTIETWLKRVKEATGKSIRKDGLRMGSEPNGSTN
jgi:hypothetical protein